MIGDDCEGSIELLAASESKTLSVSHFHSHPFGREPHQYPHGSRRIGRRICSENLDVSALELSPLEVPIHLKNLE
ncbi:uncharacterized protein [Drosophila takahashii]|uniref:uncharacterized protein isoform X3 n=1 Tax=Drosophila takahashii TaxID=29030 RepID=UPI0038992225